METYYAHSGKKKDLSDGQPLQEHLREVAWLAEQFARQARPGDDLFAEAARSAGLLHDLGKYQPQWQRWAREFQRLKTGVIPDKAIAHTDYDRNSERDKEIERQANANVGRRPKHSSTGAQKAEESKATPLALIIGGHHGGLSDVTALRRQILEDNPAKVTAWEAALAELPELERLAPPTLPFGTDILHLEMLIRFLFSCLIDADRTDTAGESATTPSWAPSALLEKVKEEVTKLARKQCDARVRQLRNEVFGRCLARAEDDPGIFTLTVPTGGAKTLASVAFALKHAAKHNLNRVVVVIPYISIIEQNAAVYRGVFGDEVVLEHHSNVGIASDDGNEAEDRSRLATENWDARIIVTTSVRFFESLFANHPSQCRRVHRMARSVIVFDEVQTLPVGLLTPILSALKYLTNPRGFGSSLVLCTATQPALGYREEFAAGFENTKEIMGTASDVQRLFDLVRYRWTRPSELAIPILSWQQVARGMIGANRALAIVNTKRQARELFEAVKAMVRESGNDVPIFHLSTAMCPAHRRAVLDRIKSLDRESPCLLVATQCVEAGVDLDFPLVYRALGPLDSLAQAAGRCNREGLGEGKLIVFLPEEHVLPPHAYKTGAEIARTMLQQRPDLDLHLPESFASYFRSLYNVSDPDEKRIQKLRQNLQFRDVGREFKLIDDETESVIVHYGRANRFLNALKKRGPSKRLFRQLQPFTVNLYRKFAGQQKGFIEDGPFGLKLWNRAYYSKDVGIVTVLDIDKSVV